MGRGVNFDGANDILGAPPGEEERVTALPIFVNGVCVVSCWELSDAELEEINRTKRVFLSSWSGSTMFPCFVGSESVVRSVVVDFGKVWKGRG